MIALMTSCASGKIVLSNDANISKYKYVIFGKETSGDRELDDKYHLSWVLRLFIP